MRRQRRDRSIGTRTLVSAVLLVLSIRAPVAFAESQATQTQSIEVSALTTDIPAQLLVMLTPHIRRRTAPLTS